MNQEDHDLLLEIKGDVKHFMSILSNHFEDDRIKFERIEKDTEFHNKIVYGCIGVIVFMEFVLKFIK